MATRNIRLAPVEVNAFIASPSRVRSDLAVSKPFPRSRANDFIRSSAMPNVGWPSQRQIKPEFVELLPPQIGFLASYGIVPALLLKAASIARELHVFPEEVLLKNNIIGDVLFYSCLADHLGLRFIDWPVFLQQDIAYPQAIHAGIAPLRGDEGAAFIAAPQGQALSFLLKQGSRGRRLAITTPHHLSELVRASSALPILQGASFALGGFDKDLTAFTPPKRIHTLGLNALLLALLAGALSEPKGFLSLMSLILGLIFFAGILYRLLVSAASFLKPAPIAKTFRKTAQPNQPGAFRRQEIALANRDLPLYSIVIALHKEASVVKKLIAALERIDYPKAKLEIKLVIEKGDSETHAALKAENLGSCYEIIVAPPGWPKTKPRALNIALPLLRGKLMTIFDAEDEPEPNQLRQAALRFAQGPPELGCLQARLAIDNVEDSWLTKLFAIEYSVLFDVLDKGISELGMPLALGGTSNHFRTSVLQKLRGWDAWNMTEDADLGIRLSRFGYKVETISSTTLEEAPAKLGPWLKQRRRWFKGWMQTAAVLSRDPARVYRELGLRRSTALCLSLVTLVVSPLVSPICAALVTLHLITTGIPAPQSTPELVETILWTSVTLFGSASTIWLTLLGMRRRGLLSLWTSLPLLPAYYLLMFFSAWAAFYDFIFNPFHWHKTAHGLAKTSKHRSGPPADRLQPTPA